MNRIIFALAACMLFTAFPSCNKIIPVPSGFPNPLNGDNQVAEFHIPLYDDFYPDYPFLFRKTYDPSGKTLKEIVFSFNNDIAVADIMTYTYDFLVESKGRVVYFIEKASAKNGLPDTAFRLYLNAQGRPDSCIGNTGFLPAPASYVESEYYYYKDNRFLAVKDNKADQPFPPIFSTSTDTMHYDKFGNPSSFLGNIYQYDTSRTVALQFLCDDFVGSDDLFYLLEYLGYFPEITSPVNIRTQTVTINNPPPGSSETAQQFDREGRLISYFSHEGGNITITWNSK
jgi:hypothetical protein